MTTQETVPQTTGQRETERPSRARTLLLLVSLLDQLPAPEEICFIETHVDALRIQLASASDWDAWVKQFDAYVWSNRIRHADTVQCSASADWLGWRVSLSMCTRNPGQERLTADEAASVRGMDTIEPYAGREDPETGEPLPAGVEGYRVGDA